MRRAALVLALLAAAALAPRAAQRAGWLPLRSVPVEDEVSGDRNWNTAGGSGAVLLAAAGPPQVDRFSSGDWSWSWINLLQQEVGPYAVAAPVEGPPAGATLAVLPRALAGEAPAWWRGWVEAGGVLLVECPGAPWSADLGVAGVRAPLAMRELRAALLSRPLRAVIAACAPTGVQGDVVAEDDAGRPLLWRRTLGDGALFGLGFDLGQSVLAMQQGIPADDLQVENRYPDRHRPLLQTSDLVADESFLNTDDAAADRLERLIGLAVDDVAPRPRLWHLADAAPGAFVMTHDDEGFGDASRWMTEHEARIGAVSSSLFMPSRRLSRAGLAAIATDGGEIGLHWNRVDEAGAPYESTRRLGVEWSRRRHTLAEQVAWLRALSPEGATLRSARTHFLTWGPDYGSAFRALAAQGFDIDSSYGVDFGELGYLFGTGGPFQALDVNGLPLPVWELPHLLAEDLEATAGWLDRILADSEADLHQVVNVLFHPNDMDWRPSVTLYRLWKGSYEQARAHGHAIFTLSEVVDHWRRRLAGDVRIERTAGGWRVHVHAQGAGHAVALPAEWRGRPLEVRRDDVHRVREEGRATLLVPVPPGPSMVEVTLGAR